MVIVDSFRFVSSLPIVTDDLLFMASSVVSKELLRRAETACKGGGSSDEIERFCIVLEGESETFP